MSDVAKRMALFCFTFLLSEEFGTQVWSLFKVGSCFKLKKQKEEWKFYLRKLDEMNLAKAMKHDHRNECLTQHDTDIKICKNLTA